MTNVLNFPSPTEVEVISEEAFRKYTDAALLLKCFEVVKDTLDVINEPEYQIEKEDDTHIDLIRAFYALKVLFDRKTGNDAAAVSQEHWDAMRQHLLQGTPYPDQLIPVASALISPIPPDGYSHLSNLELACAAYNAGDKVRLGTIATLSADNAQIKATMAVEAINATTALGILVRRLAGGSLTELGQHILGTTGAGSETLQ
ncbi:hypothetical protein IYR97_03390 [Pseudomonas fulva]|mgnify:CR=1 FL=1|uniref:Uncharacterized protein n=1 Tax=Pseudomonas fulva TaxID=47880 RepID=A0A7S9LIY0_9PSED|nr:hypothetical protein [Pseudomonas fulva]AVF54179.1 hypothetical protein AL527_02770 [Pseudomonas fulva]MBA1206562.1 hypothetical protein [Pseudomonas fulva]QPH44706.1 hypothetical protein IYR97_03390 [Pseudomonas fulva]QPH49781.1 hypothetical protein IZU98_03360 [Pseudomonas fulva]